MKNIHGKDDSWLLAVGEVEGKRFEIRRVTKHARFTITWFILEDGKITMTTDKTFETEEQAIEDVMKILAPDAIPVEYVEPTAEDFEALNALLYVGGLQSEITTFQEALIMYTGFQEGLPIMLAGREKMSHDLDQITNDLKAVRGAMSDRVQNLIKMKEVVMVQYDILETITTRNLETLFSFIDQFLKK